MKPFGRMTNPTRMTSVQTFKMETMFWKFMVRMNAVIRQQAGNFRLMMENG
jgi:hypothetical protein